MNHRQLEERKACAATEIENLDPAPKLEMPEQQIAEVR
jgi:hypothetical protein